MERWATFDCYGTLINWNGGIRGQLARVFGEERADALLPQPRPTRELTDLSPLPDTLDELVPA